MSKLRCPELAKRGVLNVMFDGNPRSVCMRVEMRSCSKTFSDLKHHEVLLE